MLTVPCWPCNMINTPRHTGAAGALLPQGGRIIFPLDDGGCPIDRLQIDPWPIRALPVGSGLIGRRKSSPSGSTPRHARITAGLHENHSEAGPPLKKVASGALGTRQPLSLAGGSCPRLLQGIVEHKDACCPWPMTRNRNSWVSRSR